MLCKRASADFDPVYERIMKLIEESPVPVILLNEVLEYAQSLLEKGD